MTTASSVPSWVIAVNVAPGSVAEGSTSPRMRRCALDEIGRNSVRPWTRPRTSASRKSIRSACQSPGLKALPIRRTRTDGGDMTTELAPLIRDASRAVWAYVDASVTNGAPAVASARLRNDIRTRLEVLHASPEDIDALDDALADYPGVGSPASRYLLIRDGRIEVDEVYASPPLQSPLVGAGLVP